MGKLPTALARGGLAAVLCLALAVFASVRAAAQTHGVLSLAALRAEKNLTPERFIRAFADFKFELSDRLQEADTFLQRKSGDCDDFASLAASLLTQRGYTTKVVVVMMGGQTHVVCFVKEAHGYLDFNHRADAQPVIESDGSLEDIADKTAAYFKSNWYMASEIRYEHARPVFVDNAFPRGGRIAAPKPAGAKSEPAPIVVAAEKADAAPVSSEPEKPAAPAQSSATPAILN